MARARALPAALCLLALAYLGNSFVAAPQPSVPRAAQVAGVAAAGAMPQVAMAVDTMDLDMGAAAYCVPHHVHLLPYRSIQLYTMCSMTHTYIWCGTG